MNNFEIRPNERMLFNQCYHCCFFSLDLFFFYLGVLSFLLKIWVFLTLVKF